MPENTIVSSSNNNLRQFEENSRIARDDTAQTSTTETADISPDEVTTPVSVDVKLSREGLELSTSQQVNNNRQPDAAQNQNVESEAVDTAAVDTAAVDTAAVDTAAVDTAGPQRAETEPELDEAAQQEATEPVQEDESDPVSQQLNPTADAALGTLIDVFD